MAKKEFTFAVAARIWDEWLTEGQRQMLRSASLDTEQRVRFARGHRVILKGGRTLASSAGTILRKACREAGDRRLARGTWERFARDGNEYLGRTAFAALDWARGSGYAPKKKAARKAGRSQPRPARAKLGRFVAILPGNVELASTDSGLLLELIAEQVAKLERGQSVTVCREEA